jgi:hypothetical protein
MPGEASFLDFIIKLTSSSLPRSRAPATRAPRSASRAAFPAAAAAASVSAASLLSPAHACPQPRQPGFFFCPLQPIMARFQ